MTPQTIRMAERRVRDYREAADALKSDPDNIMLLVRTGQLHVSAGDALRYRENIERISQLEGYSFRDLMMIPNMGRIGAEQIVALAAERGIEIARPPTTDSARARAERREAARLIWVRDDGEPGVSYEASVRLAGEPSMSWFFISSEIVGAIAPQVAEQGAEVAWARTNPELLYRAALKALERYTMGAEWPAGGGPFKVQQGDLINDV